ncbi:MAG: ribosome silencing factor [Eubacteriales bacterium]|nr:ribosome silencing factor [Clostridia bacterium]MDZ4041992.1 ribosome silencing factor [Eubacteriales bacterium]MDZ7609118.1 ribosome silencing factor [Eubacteriales bacterium]
MQRAVQAAENVKGYDQVVLDIHKLTVISDYFLIVSGRSTTHVKAISEHVMEELEAEGVYPLRREGQKEGRWILLDYNHLVVHVFLDEERAFYNLERLWGDAPVVDVRAGVQA